MAARTRERGAVALLAAALAFACSGETPPAPERPNLLFLCVDTLRADHLGAYGHRLETSPTLDALAASGVRFADASVQWTKTWPSMASMLTGTYPTQTGVRHHPRRPLPERNLTLAEILRDEGYRTAAVVANANLGRRFAFDQGFEHFVESWMEEYRRRFGEREFENRPGLTKTLTTGRRVVDEGLAWLDGLAPGEPFFLWLHFMEPHGPYLPPRRHAERFRDAYPRRVVPPRALPPYQLRRGPGGRPVRDLGFYQARYDGEIRHFDDVLGRLLGELEARGLRRDTLVVLTADHGESLDEHGYFLEHGVFPFQPTAHVPLLLVHEGRLPAGRVVPHPVGLVDLVPTLLDLLGVSAPEGLAGRSLESLLRGADDAAPPYVFVEAGVREPSQRAVRQGRWKLVHFRAAEDRRLYRMPEWALYDLDSDPGERRNVLAEHPERAAELREALRRYADTAVASGRDGGDLELEELDAQTREQLRALGYLDEETESAPEAEGGKAARPGR